MSTGIVSIWLAATSPLWALDQKDRFLEFPDETETATYDLRTVQLIQPGRFTISYTVIANPDVMRFEFKVLAKLRTYCASADGHYPAPSDLLTLGPPDMPIKDIEVRSDVTRVAGKAYPFKIASWPYPYQKLAKYYAISLHCKYSNRTEADLYSEAMSRITNGFSGRTVYDCRRGLHSLPLIKDEELANARMFSIRKGTYAFHYYEVVCGAVMHELPYIPE
jgi:hypothetical protein